MGLPRKLVALAALVAGIGCSPGDDDAASLCTPETCESLSAECGEVPDGCEGTLACGSCPGGQACGAGGAHLCGTVTASPCVPTTCEALGKNCGPILDGCDGILDCGDCPEGETCSGGGVSNVCGTPPPPACRPTTCAAAGAECGSLGDGCGGTLQCGTCPQGETCGGGGTANVCGTPPPPACQPTTCAAAGAECGLLGDGCGGTLQCGTCPQGETCGGGGTANVCGAPPPPACEPTTCEAAGAECGLLGDGCGGTLQCGTCPEGETCGGGGTANVCSAPPPPACEPTTCEAAGEECGPVPDGCGGTLDCGPCPEGQTS
jgi:hypothetical protein